MGTNVMRRHDAHNRVMGAGKRRGDGRSMPNSRRAMATRMCASRTTFGALALLGVDCAGCYKSEGVERSRVWPAEGSLHQYIPCDAMGPLLNVCGSCCFPGFMLHTYPLLEAFVGPKAVIAKY